VTEACEEGGAYLFLYEMRGNSLISSKILSFSRKTLHPGVTKLVTPFFYRCPEHGSSHAFPGGCWLSTR